MGVHVTGEGHETNWLFRNLGDNPLVGYNFMLRVEALFDLPCKSVKGFEKKNEFEPIQEGGLNDYVHLRRKPITQPFTFQVERYVGVDYFDPLPNGAELALPIVLIVSRNQNNDYNFVPLFAKRTYIFTHCVVMGKQYGELDAERSGLLLETTTIAYHELVVFDNPVDVEMDKMSKENGKLKVSKGVSTHKDQKTPDVRSWLPSGSTKHPKYYKTNTSGVVTNNSTQQTPTPRSWLKTDGSKHPKNYKQNTSGVITNNKNQAVPQSRLWQYDSGKPTKNLPGTPNRAISQKKPKAAKWNRKLKVDEKQLSPEIHSWDGKKKADPKQKKPEVFKWDGSLKADKKQKTPGLRSWNRKLKKDENQQTPESEKWEFPKDWANPKNLKRTPNNSKTQKKPEVSKWDGKFKADSKQETPEASKWDGKFKADSKQKTPEASKWDGKLKADDKQKKPIETKWDGRFKTNPNQQTPTPVEWDRKLKPSPTQKKPVAYKWDGKYKRNTAQKFPEVRQWITPGTRVKSNYKQNTSGVITGNATQKLPTVRRWPPTKSAVTIVR